MAGRLRTAESASQAQWVLTACLALFALSLSLFILSTSMAYATGPESVPDAKTLNLSKGTALDTQKGDGPVRADVNTRRNSSEPRRHAWSSRPPYETPAYTRPPDDSVVFGSLLEAAGYAIDSNSDWVDIAAGNFCGGPEKELVLLKNKHSNFSILRGPAPYAVGTGDLTSSSSHPWRAVSAGNLDGGAYDEIVAVRKVTASGVPDLVIAKVDGSSCDVSAIIAPTTIGNPSNSEWVGAAVGDFDGTGRGTGRKQIALLKLAHSNFVFVKLTSAGELSVFDSSDLDSSPSQPWKALAAGDIDGDGVDELIAARQVSDGHSPTVLAYKWTGSGFTLFATSTFGNNGNSDWSSMAVGDFNGDGRNAIVLVKNQHSNFVLLDLPTGATELKERSTEDLDSVKGQDWRGLAATDWLSGNDQGASELIAVRAARRVCTLPPSGDCHYYRTDLFVYGDPFNRISRDTGLERTKAQIDPQAWGDLTKPATIDALKKGLQDTHTDVFNWTHDRPGDYFNLVNFLEATKDFAVDGKQLRVWVTLLPPKAMEDGTSCSLPEDSMLTTWNELDYFKKGKYGIFGSCGKEIEVQGPPGEPTTVQFVPCDYCQDLLGWASLIGRLAQDYPQLVALGIDDYGHSLNDFPGDYVAELESRMRSQAPWLNFVPTVYYGDFYESASAFPIQPDIARTFDTMLFYFRNEKEGGGSCSCCSHHLANDACLDGVCAEPTVTNAPDEFSAMSALLPAGRKLQVGVYFTAHSRLGEPSARYDYDLVNLALNLPWLGGTTDYTSQSPPGVACTEVNFLDNKYCTIQRAYGLANLANPVGVPLTGVVHIQDLGDRPLVDNQWAGTKGHSRRLEGFSVNFVTPPSGVTFEYMCHVQDRGDLPWMGGGTFCGTRGESKRLEGFAIHLTGANAGNYDVFYSCHVQDVGDTGPYKNGAFCGTRGQSKRVEALDIWVTEKSNVGLQGVVHLQNIGDRSFTQDTFAGTRGQSRRLEGFSVALSPGASDLGVEYMCHLQDLGDTPWKANGDFCGTRGESRRLEGVAIRLTGPAAAKSDIYYYCHMECIGDFLPVKNGDFCGTRGESRGLEGLYIWAVRR